jgi:hypothetical protein
MTNHSGIFSYGFPPQQHEKTDAFARETVILHLTHTVSIESAAPIHRSTGAVIE